MFDPSKFSPARPASTIIIGNSEHPVRNWCSDLKRIPSKYPQWAGIYYTEILGHGMVTYRESDSTFAYHSGVTLAALKEVVTSGGRLASSEIVDADPKSKYLGNDIMLLLKCEDVIA